MPPDRAMWPAWVRLGLWGLPNRASAWLFVWLSLACAAAAIPAGFLLHPVCFVGVLMIFAALWYYLSIRWVDQNSRWN